MVSDKHFCYQKNAGVRVQEVLAFQWVASGRRERDRQRSLAIGPFVAADRRSAQDPPKLLIMLVLCAANRARPGDRMSTGRLVEGAGSLVVLRS